MLTTQDGPWPRVEGGSLAIRWLLAVGLFVVPGGTVGDAGTVWDRGPSGEPGTVREAGDRPGNR